MVVWGSRKEMADDLLADGRVWPFPTGFIVRSAR